MTEPVADESVPLPSYGSGRRVRRRQEEQLRRRRRRNSLVALVVLLASLGGLAALLGPLLSDDEESADAPTEATLTAGPAPVAAPKALFVQVDEDNELSAITVAALRDGEPGGTVVFVPTRSLLDVPGFGLEPMADAWDRGGEELISLTVENLLGVGFDHVVVLDERSWGPRLEPLTELTVTNPSPVEEGDAGRFTTVWPEGTFTLRADEIGRFLTATSVDEPDLVRLLRHDAFWRAWLEASAEIDRPVGDPGEVLDAFLDELDDGDVDYRILPVETLSGTGSETVYRMDLDGIAELVAELAPETGGDTPARVRVQLLNGVGTPGLAAVATELLVPAGARIDLRDNARSFDVEVTQIVYYRDEQRDGAERLRTALGLGEVVRERQPLDVVDVTIVLGQDFVDTYVD